MTLLLLGVALLTIILEYPITRLILKKQNKLFINTALINGVTNLSLNLLIFLLVVGNLDILLNTVGLLFCEVIVVIIEAIMYMYCYKNINKKRIIVSSLLSNSFSCGVGLLISMLLELL